MIKIKVCDVAPLGGCSYYRGIGVLSKLRKINPEINVEHLQTVSWPVLSDCDILFMMRPVENNYIAAITSAKNYGIPVWIDFDDCLHEMPADNPYRIDLEKNKQLENMKKNMENAISLADFVSVSTPEIKEYYKKFNPNIVVIENAFNDYNYKLKYKSNDERFISWRGSNTHRVDLLSCAEDMILTSRKFPGQEWVFIGGDNPWFITDKIQKSGHYPDMEITRYNKYFYDLGPSIHMVPLVDSIFNRAKSNISWVEGTYAGAVCLCPDLPEFRVPGAVTYTDNFAYLLEKLIKSKTFRQENYEKSLQFIKDNLLLSKINQKRIEIVEKAVK